jgi:hypothetical protein
MLGAQALDDSLQDAPLLPDQHPKMISPFPGLSLNAPPVLNFRLPGASLDEVEPLISPVNAPLLELTDPGQGLLFQELHRCERANHQLRRPERRGLNGVRAEDVVAQGLLELTVRQPAQLSDLTLDIFRGWLIWPAATRDFLGHD